MLSEYLTEKYAGILSEEDVNLLFKTLIKVLGNNRSRAARECGVTDKATYDWETANYIKLGTKRKVLRASLTHNYLSAIEFLLQKSKDRNLDLLETIFSTLYADGLEANTKEEFNDKLRRFEEIRSRNIGLIQDGLQREVLEMSMALKTKAEQFGIAPKPATIKDYSGEEILNLISMIGNLYSENPIQAEIAAEKDFRLPITIMKPIITTFKTLSLGKIGKVSDTEEQVSEFKPHTFFEPQTRIFHSINFLQTPNEFGGMIYEGPTSA